jgi:hypothetical protein
MLILPVWGGFAATTPAVLAIVIAQEMFSLLLLLLLLLLLPMREGFAAVAKALKPVIVITREMCSLLLLLLPTREGFVSLLKQTDRKRIKNGGRKKRSKKMTKKSR